MKTSRPAPPPTDLLARVKAKLEELAQTLDSFQALRKAGPSAEELATIEILETGTLEAVALLEDVRAELERHAPPGPRLHFSFHRPVASKKNSKERRTVTLPDGRVSSFTGKSRQAGKDEKALGTAARIAANGQGFRLIAEDDVELRYTFTVGAGLDVEIRGLGPKPKKGPSGRDRDVHGMLETIADALNGIAYTNDRQVARVIVERRYPNPP